MYLFFTLPNLFLIYNPYSTRTTNAAIDIHLALRCRPVTPTLRILASQNFIGDLHRHDLQAEVRLSGRDATAATYGSATRHTVIIFARASVPACTADAGHFSIARKQQ